MIKSVRWKIGIFMFLGIVINYMDRVNISHAIVFITDDMGLSPIQQGIIMSSFSWGYVLFMMVGGWMVDRFGPRVMNCLACLAWSAFTAMGALVNNYSLFLLSRFLLGAGEAPIFPGNASVVKRWFPVHERGKATALFDVGSYVGAALVAPIIIYMMIKFGWRPSFLIFGGVGVIWSIAWFFYYRDPEDHKNVSEEEKAYINEGANKITSTFKDVSIKTLLSYRKIWGMSLGFFSYNYLKNFFLTWFPSYLIAERGFSFMKVGFVALIPPMCAIVAELLVGHLTDSLIRKGVDITYARKIPLCLGMLLSSVIILATLTASPFWTIFFLSLSYASVISASTGIWSIPGDVAPNKDAVGRIGGIQNTFSNMAGIIAPIVTGALFGLTGSFALPLLVSGIIAIIGAFSYWFIVGELVPLPVKR
ncbi:MAG: MFS transporter [Candidatus Peribacteraceae bacterium]|nr:MFS transporter [Candidatus Peribacteraceae bacterium]